MEKSRKFFRILAPETPCVITRILGRGLIACLLELIRGCLFCRNRLSRHISKFHKISEIRDVTVVGTRTDGLEWREGQNREEMTRVKTWIGVAIGDNHFHYFLFFQAHLRFTVKCISESRACLIRTRELRFHRTRSIVCTFSRMGTAPTQTSFDWGALHTSVFFLRYIHRNS